LSRVLTTAGGWPESLLTWQRLCLHLVVAYLINNH
jgi:hypothetical protein